MSILAANGGGVTFLKMANRWLVSECSLLLLIKFLDLHCPCAYFVEKEVVLFRSAHNREARNDTVTQEFESPTGNVGGSFCCISTVERI